MIVFAQVELTIQTPTMHMTSASGTTLYYLTNYKCTFFSKVHVDCKFYKYNMSEQIVMAEYR